MDYQTIIYEVRENVGWITLNRPDVLNAQNDTVREELTNAVNKAKADDNVRVLVITGAGDKAFSAGADITMFPKMSSADAITMFKGEKRAVQTIRELLKPVVAMVNGLALGGGCELAMACDIIIAAEDAKFGQPEINVGIIPGGGGSQILTRLIGEKKAKELIMTGGVLSAKEALGLGLVNKVVPGNELLETVEKLVNKIKTKSPVILKLGKIAVNKALETSLSVGLESEKELFAMCFGTKDQKEGATAFLEKRKPEFTGQ